MPATLCKGRNPPVLADVILPIGKFVGKWPRSATDERDGSVTAVTVIAITSCGNLASARAANDYLWNVTTISSPPPEQGRSFPGAALCLSAAADPALEKTPVGVVTAGAR